MALAWADGKAREGQTFFLSTGDAAVLDEKSYGLWGVRREWRWVLRRSYPQALQAAKQWLRLGVDVRHTHQTI